MKKLTLIQAFFLIFTINIHSQVLVNQVWENTVGEPGQLNLPFSQWDNIDWQSTALTNSGALITVGNTLQATGNTDILTTKQGSNGQILWQKNLCGKCRRLRLWPYNLCR